MSVLFSTPDISKLQFAQFLSIFRPFFSVQTRFSFPFLHCAQCCHLFSGLAAHFCVLSVPLEGPWLHFPFCLCFSVYNMILAPFPCLLSSRMGQCMSPFRPAAVRVDDSLRTACDQHRLLSDLRGKKSLTLFSQSPSIFSPKISKLYFLWWNSTAIWRSLSCLWFSFMFLPCLWFSFSEMKPIDCCSYFLHFLCPHWLSRLFNTAGTNGLWSAVRSFLWLSFVNL